MAKKVKDPNKIGLGEKLCYMLTQMGCTPVLNLATSFLTLYYITICGLDAAAVGTLFLISKLFDGINDPVVGYIMDHLPRSKMGKFRHLMIIGTLICSLNMLAVWFGPYIATTGKLVVAYVSYLLLGVTYDIMDIAKNSVGAVMTNDPGERASLNVFGSFGSLLSTMLVSIAGPLIITALGNGFPAYRTLIWVAFVYAVVLMTGGALGVKERVTAVDEANDKYSFKDYGRILSAKPCLVMIFFAIMYAVGQYISIGFDTYYFTFVLEDLGAMSTVSMLTLVTMLVGTVLSKSLSVKIGRKQTIVLSMVIMIVGLVIRYVFAYELWAAYVGSMIFRFGIGMELPAQGVINAENMDYIEYKMGVRAESALTSVSTFLSKVGSAIGGALPAYLLAIAGYNADSGIIPESLPGAICGWGFLFPIALFAIGAVIIGVGYKMDYAEVRAGLDQRKAEIEAGQQA